MDEHTVARALRGVLRTIRHAELLFDTCVGELGDRARVHALAEGKVRKLFVRDDATVIPWQLLTISRIPAKRLDIDLGLGPPIEVPERPEVAPALRGMGPGHVVVHDGGQSIQVTYREDGLWKETTRRGPPDTLRPLLEALGGEDAAPVDRLAAFLCALDLDRHGPARVLERAPFPDGPGDAWVRALHVARQALHERTVSDAPGWLVADPFATAPPVHAPTRHAALADWQVAAYTELTPCPLPDHPWGPWRRLLGPCGESHWALERFHPNGFTLVGQDAVARLDLDGLDAALDEADRALPELPSDPSEAWKGEQPSYPCVSVRYRLENAAHGPATLRYESSRQGEQSDAATLLDGAELRGAVFRQLWG